MRRNGLDQIDLEVVSLLDLAGRGRAGRRAALRYCVEVAPRETLAIVCMVAGWLLASSRATRAQTLLLDTLMMVEDAARFGRAVHVSAQPC